MENLTKDRLIGEKTQQGSQGLTGIDQRGNQRIQELENTVTSLRSAQNTAESFLAVLENLIDAVVMVDLKGTVTFFNAAAENLWGFTQAEVMGDTVKKLIPGFYDHYLRIYAGNGIRSQIGSGKEFNITRKNGSVIPTMLTLSESHDGNEPYYAVFVKDISERKEWEAEAKSLKQVVDMSQATIEFETDGTILKANDAFLNALGYSLDEIRGRNHKMFCGSDFIQSGKWDRFWNELRAGKMQSGEFRRIRKDGSDCWISAAYTPVFDAEGKVVKILKMATEITDVKVRSLENEGKLNAVDKSQAIIEFEMDGTVITANRNFLNLLGYTMEEVKGMHHSMFILPEEANSMEYKSFWKRLNTGQFMAGNYHRIGKGGDDVYIQASYNPILDHTGKPFKVVKFATDMTDFTKGFQATIEFIDNIKKGNLDVDMDLRGATLDGDIGKVVEDLISLRENIKNILNEVTRVVQVAGAHGQLSERLQLSGLDGSWSELVSSINNLLESISTPIVRINEIVSLMAQGDLSQRLELNAEGDIQTLANGLNIALANINSLLTDVQSNGLSIASSSAQLQDKSSGIKNNMTEVASAIQEMASGAHTQASKADDASKLVEAILKSAKEMEEVAQKVIETSEKEQQKCQDGLNTMEVLVTNMDDISRGAETTSSTIAALTKRSEEISRTLTVITDIAGQTNLLALNAAIEAARAGDAGRGFAVVAEEIRKLAEDSRKSAGDIDQVIIDVQKDVIDASKAIESMISSVSGGTDATKRAESAFQEIATNSSETFSLSKKVAEAAKAQETDIDHVVKNIEEIVVVAEETASGTEEVASSSQSLSNAMVDVNQTSDSLAQIADELRTGLSKFKLGNKA
jgi:methyl-accepting chemotaxis protein